MDENENKKKPRVKYIKKYNYTPLYLNILHGNAFSYLVKEYLRKWSIKLIRVKFGVNWENLAEKISLKW